MIGEKDDRYERRCCLILILVESRFSEIEEHARLKSEGLSKKVIIDNLYFI